MSTDCDKNLLHSIASSPQPGPLISHSGTASLAASGAPTFTTSASSSGLGLSYAGRLSVIDSPFSPAMCAAMTLERSHAILGSAMIGSTSMGSTHMGSTNPGSSNIGSSNINGDRENNLDENVQQNSLSLASASYDAFNMQMYKNEASMYQLNQQIGLHSPMMSLSEKFANERDTKLYREKLQHMMIEPTAVVKTEVHEDPHVHRSSPTPIVNPSTLSPEKSLGSPHSLSPTASSTANLSPTEKSGDIKDPKTDSGFDQDVNEEYMNDSLPYVINEDRNIHSPTYSDSGDEDEIHSHFRSPDQNSHFHFSLDKPPNGTDDQEDVNRIFECELCNYTTSSHGLLTSHVEGHRDVKCTECDFITRKPDELLIHLEDLHKMHELEAKEMVNIQVPKINAQGRIKSFKCKQCSHVAHTKIDFWEHSRIHIKREKQLECKKCPFVTEYKHHLDYHMRNHVKSKPFQCDKCKYSCVNKSMLNSHKKSHSNVYQYRCADCSYATKYCHSLKLHLRKYDHRPAMVLNPDGTPNPIPVIDVYGTRRGPKIRKDDNGNPIIPDHYRLQAQIMKAQMEATGTIPPAPTPEDAEKLKKLVHPGPSTSSLQQQQPLSFGLSGLPSYHASPILSRALIKNGEPSEDEMHQNEEHLRELFHENENKFPFQTSHLPGLFSSLSSLLKCNYCHYSTLNRDALLQHIQYYHQNLNVNEDQNAIPKIEIPDERQSVSPVEELHPIIQAHLNKMQENSGPPANLNEAFTRVMNMNYLKLYQSRGLIPPFNIAPQFRHLVQHDAMPLQHFLSSPDKGQSQPLLQASPEEQNGQVLDLSKEQSPPQMVPSLGASPALFHSTPNTKSSRKEKGYKLECIAMKLTGSVEGESNAQEFERQDKKESLSSPQPKLMSPPPTEEESQGSCSDYSLDWLKKAHTCQYCDMAFKDTVLYTMHMGYHGYNNPFNCNMCGFDAKDKIEFTVHISTAKHT